MHVCSNCRRHVREIECPFCHTVHATSDDKPVSAPFVSREGLRRGALVASVVAMTACGPTVVAAYGIPIDSSTDASSQDDASDAAATDTMSSSDTSDAPLAAYGLPPEDAGEDVNVMPPYGLPPEDAGTE